MSQASEPAPADDVAATLGLGPPRRRRRWPWVLGVLALVLGIGAWLATLAPGQGQWEYTTRPVELGDLTVTVTAVGTLEPLDTVSIASELSGIVLRVDADANDQVRAGQVLAVLDTALLEAQERQARAQVAASEANVVSARTAAVATARERDRAEALASSGSISTASVESARTAADQAVAAVGLGEAQLAQSRASLSAARTNLDKARIISPIDGVVLERSVEPGQAVVSALQVATLFRVARDLTAMSVEVDVDEADIGRVRAGQRATFTVAAWPDRVFEARVDRVLLAPSTAQQVVTYDATLTLDNPDLVLLPGMTATAQIEAETHEDVLLVPNAALRFSPPGSDLYPPEPRAGRQVSRVWRLDGDEPVPVELFVGATDGRRSMVNEGEIKEGDLLVTGAEPRGGRRS